MRAVGFTSQGGTLYTILVAIGGAILLTWLYRMILGPRGQHPIEEKRGDTNLRKVA